MNYLGKTLTFESDRIYFYDEEFGDNRSVMMDWEDSLMSASAAYVCTRNIITCNITTCTYVT